MSIETVDIQFLRIHLYLRQRRAEGLRKAAMTTPFRRGGARLLLVTQPERIPQSQIFPFHYYAEDFEKLYDAELREADVWQVLSGTVPPATGATVVAFQTPFDIADSDLYQLVGLLRQQNPGARLAVLDWFAPTDLRNADRMNGLVDLYVKKHLLRERELYGQPTVGDTNLTDYYNHRFGTSEPKQCFTIPPEFFEKVVLGPSFATAPMILPALLDRRPNGPRPIDLHARFATKGTPWYTGMRRESETALCRVTDLAILQGEGVPLARFMREIARSKLCFSPFGYGEVCWRDYEAIAAGAVLLKQDMSHIQTDPDIFVPWETYVPLRWDLEDFEETVRRLTRDAALRERIADQAFCVLHDWVKSDRFARAMAPLLD